MGKKIRGSYYIADCEHRGDVSRSEAFLRSLGCEVIGSYWDGVDCGEAHTDFYVSEGRFVPLYYRLGHSCSFDADINDYLHFEADLPYRMMSEGEFLGLKESMSEDCSVGFWERLPLLLWFDCSTKRFSVGEILGACLSKLEHPYEVLGYYYVIVDGVKYCRVLLSSSYLNMVKGIMESGIGDFSLGRSGWLKENRIYGEISCVHKYVSKDLCRDYTYFQRLLACIRCGLPLEYMYGDGWHYRSKAIVVGSGEYMGEGGVFLPKLFRDGKEYALRCPIGWDWGRTEYRDVVAMYR